MYIVSLYMAVNERSVTVRRLVIMALPVINTIFVIVILLFDIKPFIKTVINEFKEITKWQIMSTEKDTYQKSGTSVVFQKEIKQCRECPHCLIVPDPDPNDWFNDDDEKALCKESENKLIEGMLRPYERVLIPDWCPLKTNKQKWIELRQKPILR